ncbi:MAG: hypothetical protein C0492_05540 [Verminephrobacter sp.]|nr:hypothetical protein [Verminephrobacter sp.]
MKMLLATALIALAPGLALAQSQPAPAKPKASTNATVAKKPVAKSSSKTVVAKAEPTSSRVQLKSAANQVAAGLMAARAVLTTEELAIAERVHVGQIPCELGATVSVLADPDVPGHFHVGGKGFKYHMSPVTTSTGTVRLEDQKAGAVWLQIANKSMLMDQKKGQRLADECMSPEQIVVAEAIKITPPPSLLDAPPAK